MIAPTLTRHRPALRLTALERRLGGARPTADVGEARAAWAAFCGTGKRVRPFLTEADGNAKLARGGGGWALMSLVLSPAGSAGIPGCNTCPWATAGCRADGKGDAVGAHGCLATAGRLRFDPAREARDRRTAFLWEYPGHAKALILSELRRAIRRYRRVAFRSGVLSDLRLEWCFPELRVLGSPKVVALYDYSKARFSDRNPSLIGLDLTWSVSERWSDADIRAAVKAGRRCALVAGKGSVWWARVESGDWDGLPVWSGDDSDARFLEGPGVVVLKAKGELRGAAPGAAGGFVR